PPESEQILGCPHPSGGYNVPPITYDHFKDRTVFKPASPDPSYPPPDESALTRPDITDGYKSSPVLVGAREEVEKVIDGVYTPFPEFSGKYLPDPLDGTDGVQDPIGRSVSIRTGR
ncbi:MAG TPA: hypothetical protein VMW89_10750, partial [Desulfatiglandales bacterium]|nr:hypothetical protein [Desulfatiglandales bacterium]